MTYPVSAHVPKPGVIPLRPLGVGGILSGAIATIRTRPVLMLGMTAIVVIVAELVALAATYPWLDDLRAVPLDENTTSADLAEVFVDTMAVTGVGLAVLLVSRVLMSGFVTVVVGTAVIGRPQTVREAWTATRPRLLPLLGLTLIYPAVLAGVGIVIFLLATVAGPLAVVAGIGAVVAGIWLMVLFTFAPTALVLENAGIGRAFGRSLQLVSGSWWRVLGITLLGLVISGAVAFVINLPFLVASGDLTGPVSFSTSSLVWSTAGAIVGSVITEPFVTAVTVLLYTDQRMRREGLAEELARTAS